MLLPAVNLIAVLFLIPTLQQFLSNWKATAEMQYLVYLLFISTQYGSIMQAESYNLPEGVNLQETVYNVEVCTYQVDLHELPSGIFGILHMPVARSVQIHGWEVKSEPGGPVYVSHITYITVPLTP
jgi:hypothetical protein